MAQMEYALGGSVGHSKTWGYTGLPSDWRSRLLPGESESEGRKRMLKTTRSQAFRGWGGPAATKPGITDVPDTFKGAVGPFGGATSTMQSPSNVPSETQNVGDVPYSTNENYQEHDFMRNNLVAKPSQINPNVRSTTQNLGTHTFGEYQDAYSNASAPQWGRYGEDRPNAAEGIWGDYETRQRSVLGTVPGAFRGYGQEFNDDRQNQFNNILFNPEVKSDQGLNEMYGNFYNQQGIV